MRSFQEWNETFHPQSNQLTILLEKFIPEEYSEEQEIIWNIVNRLESLKSGKFLIGGLSRAKIFLKNKRVRKEPSYNQVEYEALNFFNQSSFFYAPIYYGRVDGMDEFSYFEGMSEREVHKMPLEKIKQLILVLKEKNTISKTKLKNKVYVHGDLSPMNVVFLGDQLQGIIDWNSTYVGEEYEDLIYVLWTWLNLGALNRDERGLYEDILTLVKLYQPSEQLKQNFSKKMIDVMEQRLKKSLIVNQNYPRIYE